ncbi:hypothetical protein LCGC14_1959960 [marine sediment metagenome]|uniref:Uncharacterized protein n=1 Tax=marine sediment metagenome TaxID=412755 RepID=A0A0F9IC03_9ZZZZ
MSTAFYDCTYCGRGISSVQETIWQNHKPFHSECAGPSSDDDNFDTRIQLLDEGGEEKVND